MPKIKFKRSQSYNLADNSFLIHVQLLDNSFVDFSVPQDATGGDCLERVARYLNLKEVHFFGLKFEAKDDLHRWVDEEAQLRKHLIKYGHLSPHSADGHLKFGVRFFTTRLNHLHDEITRLLMYQQIKAHIMSGHLPVQNMAEKLASYALQAELGDFSSNKHTQEFIEDMDLIPSDVLQTQHFHSMIDRVQKLYARHRGMSSDNAVSMYLSTTMQLREYGHEGFEAQDGHGNAIRIGACFLGIFIKHYNGRPPLYFRWPDIQRMKAKDKNFGIETYSEEIFFRMEDKDVAKYILKELITQHTFFCEEMKSSRTRQARSRSCDPDLHPVRNKDAHPMLGTPFQKKGRYQSVQVPSSKVQTVKSIVIEDSFAMDTGKPRDSSTPKVRAEVEVHPKSSTPQPEFPRKETPILSKLVTVGRKESGRSAGRCTPKLPVAVKEADFPDGPPEEEEPIVTNVSPKISKYIPRNLRESAPIEIHSKPKVADWLPNKSDPNVMEQDITEMRIEIKSSSSSPSVTTSPVPVILNEPTDGTNQGNLEDGIPEQILEPESKKDEITVQDSEHQQDGKATDILNIPEGYDLSSNGTHLEDTVEDAVITFGSDSDSDYEDFPESTGKQELSSSDQLMLEISLDKSQERPVETPAMEEGRESSPEEIQKLIEMLEDKVQSGSLIREYSRIPKIRVGANMSSGGASRNIYRNRYKDVLPYEENRVQLNPSNNLANNDYINASYIKFTAGGQQTQYVLSQGPLPHTCTDFWQMTWELEAVMIIMATNLMEGGKVKCHQYYPDSKGEQLQFEQYRVTCTEHTDHDFGAVRNMEVKHIPTGQTRTVYHVQYTDWPDHGAPENPEHFIALMECIRELQEPGKTSVVHCSAGVGRSGVLVLMDFLMKQFRAKEAIDIPSALRELRQQRMHLLQTSQQYIFVYGAFLHYMYSLQGGH